MISIIPFNRQAKYFTQSVLLEDKVYQITFIFNSRISAWTMNLVDADGVEIFMGRRIVANEPMLRGTDRRVAPLGEIVLLDSSSEKTDPGADLVDRPIYYLDQADVIRIFGE
jgi:hypothetical protein